MNLTEFKSWLQITYYLRITTYKKVALLLRFHPVSYLFAIRGLAHDLILLAKYFQFNKVSKSSLKIMTTILIKKRKRKITVNLIAASTAK